jgi:L-lactate dehydrogenase (cytochrome)
VTVIEQFRKPFDAVRSVLRFKPLETDAVARRLARCANVDDLRSLARRRLPHGVFDYIDGGAEDEVTLADNSKAFRDVTFHPRVLRDVGAVTTASTLLGKAVAFPLALAPTGFTRIADPAGELAVARAADRAGVPYTLSTMGTQSIEAVRAVSAGRLWFQVYVWRDRGLVADMVARAAAADYEALVITVDTAVLGRRERDVRRGFSLPPKIGLGTLFDGVLHPAWTLDLLRHDPILFANVAGSSARDGTSAVSLAEYVAAQFDPSLSWRDIEWFRSLWRGPIVIKGIQTVEDAVIAADLGIEAVALSNHGGRQLDHAPTPFSLIAPVVDAIGDRAEVICDGGVRRGSDIVKALAAGATACMAGRAYLYALGAAGERGVDRCLTMLHDDVQRTMALIGATDVTGVDRSSISSW